jgi:hypothetical protein
MSVADQFEYGLIPIKPKPYKNRELAQCNELLVDYGEDASYHIYIVHHSDETKYIDITSLIVKEMLPKAEINGDQFTITIEGNKEPQSLTDIINFIYKRFNYADNSSGFIFAKDQDKLYDQTAQSVLLRLADGTIQLPVTLADNVYDKNGTSIQARLDNMTRLGFSVTYLYTTQQNQTTYEFEFPFEDYPDMLEVRIGTTYVDKTRYTITKNYDGDHHFTTGILTFIGESIENGRRIDLVWIYNTVYNPDGVLQFMSGSLLAESTVPISKLEKVSNSYNYADETSLATSKAVNNLYLALSEAINANNQNMFYLPDTASSTETNLIKINIGRAPASGDIYVVTLDSAKTTSVKLSVVNGSSTTTYNIKTPDGNSISKGFRNNQVLRFSISGNNAILLSGAITEIRTNKYIHDCVDQETEISFSGLDYSTGDLIHVYRNGVRLFQDLDYSINSSKEIITLFVRTEQGERIVFESLGI